MEIYTTSLVQNAKKVEYRGFVISNKVKSRNMFSAMGSSFKQVVGGEIGGQTKLTADTRNEVIQEIVNQAGALGANAIVGLQLETVEVFQGMLDIIAFGTAVTITK